MTPPIFGQATEYLFPCSTGKAAIIMPAAENIELARSNTSILRITDAERHLGQDLVTALLTSESFQFGFPGNTVGQ